MKIGRWGLACGLWGMLAMPAWGALIDFEGPGLPVDQVLAAPFVQGEYQFAAPDLAGVLLLRNNSGSLALDTSNFFGVYQRIQLVRVDGDPFRLFSFDVFPTQTRDVSVDPFVPGTVLQLTLSDAGGVDHTVNVTYPGHLRGVAVSSARLHVDLAALGVNYEIRSLTTYNLLPGYGLQFDNFDVRTAVPEPGSGVMLLAGLGGCAALRKVGKRGKR